MAKAISWPGLVELIVIASLIVMGWTSLRMPVHADEAVFLTMGKRLVLGDLPYRDLFDHKTPGIYLVAAGLYRVFGTSLFEVRLFMAAVIGISAYLLAKILEKHADKKYARLGALAYGGLSIWYQGNFFMTESLVNLMMILVLWLYLIKKAEHSYLGLVMMGMLMGASIIFKQSALLGAGVVYGFVILRAKSREERPRRAISLGLGLILPILIMVLWLVGSGVWIDFWQEAVIFNLVNYPAFPIGYTLVKTGKLLLPNILWWAAGFLGVGYFLLKKSKLQLVALMVLTTLPIIFTRPYHHYWLQILPYILVLAVLLIDKLKLPIILWQLWLTGLALYFLMFMSAKQYGLLQQQRADIDKNGCENIKDVAVYYFTDCVPTKYFYQVDRYEGN